MRDISNSAVPEHERNGFTFRDSSEPAVEATLCRALEVYENGWGW